MGSLALGLAAALGWGLAVVLVLLLVALALPLDLAFRMHGVASFGATLKLRGLLGLLRLRLELPSRKPRTAPRRVAKAPADAAGARRSPDWRALLGDSVLRQRVLRLARDLFAAARWQPFHLHLRLGLGDPADTGRLWALVGPLAGAAQNLTGAEVSIEPEFVDAALEFRADGQVRLVPLRWLGLLLGFVVSPPARRAWQTLRASHA